MGISEHESQDKRVPLEFISFWAQRGGFLCSPSDQTVAEPSVPSMKTKVSDIPQSQRKFPVS